MVFDENVICCIGNRTGYGKYDPGHDSTDSIGFFLGIVSLPLVKGAGFQASIMNVLSEFHDPLISGHHAGESLLLGDKDRTVEIFSAD